MDDLINVLGIGLAQAVGHMELLFHLTAKQAMHGNIGKIPNATIAKKCGWEGDPDTFINGLVKAKWLDECSNQRLIVHDWHEHCDDATKKAVVRSGIAFFRPNTPVADNGGQNLPKSASEADKICLPSLAQPSQGLAKPSLAQPLLGEECIKDFPPEVRDKAREVFSHRWFAYRGTLPNLDRQDAKQELREIADDIDTKENGYEKYMAYFAQPPPESLGRTPKLWMIRQHLFGSTKYASKPTRPSDQAPGGGRYEGLEAPSV